MKKIDPGYFFLTLRSLGQSLPFNILSLKFQKMGGFKSQEIAFHSMSVFLFIHICLIYTFEYEYIYI